MAMTVCFSGDSTTAAENPGEFEVSFEEPGYAPDQSVVMQGATLTRWMGHNGDAFRIQKWPRGGQAGNRGLWARFLYPGRRMTLFQPSDLDFHTQYDRHLSHRTEFIFQEDADFQNANAQPSGGIDHMTMYVGARAVGLVFCMNTLQATAVWPGGLFAKMGQILIEPQRTYQVRVVCLERKEYRVEINPGGHVAWSRREGPRVVTQPFAGTKTENEYSEKRVPHHWMNPEWDCVPEARLFVNNHGFTQKGSIVFDDFRFQINRQGEPDGR